MAARRFLAFLLTGWTAALPAHVPVLVCLCSHETEGSCRHGADEHPTEHAHPPGLPDGGIGGAAPTPGDCRCYEIRSSPVLVPAAASENLSWQLAVAEPPARPVDVEAAARLAAAVPRAVGPPIFLRLLALLI